MSDPKPSYIPHPLCQSDPKIPRTDLENLDTYIRDSSNPRWAAYHLVRAIARGISTHDTVIWKKLSAFADELQSQYTTEVVVKPISVHANDGNILKDNEIVGRWKPEVKQ